MSTPESDTGARESLGEVLDAYAKRLGGTKPSHYVKERPDGPYLIIEFAKPSNRQFRVHNEIVSKLSDDNIFKERSTVQRRSAAPKERLRLPETQLLRNAIAENLTIDQHSFEKGFFERYTTSVSGFEQQITANANYAVYGRRGAGKSSLLAYAMHISKRNGGVHSWVAMQTYANRSDESVVPTVISAILYELSDAGTQKSTVDQLAKELDQIAEIGGKNVLGKCDRLVPRIRRMIGEIGTPDNPLTIFLDDIHVVSESPPTSCPWLRI